MRLIRSLFAVLLGLSLIACGGGGSDSKPVTPDPGSDLPSGLAQRPANTSCVAPSRPESAVNVILEPVFSKLKFNLPVGLLQAPNDNSRWFVLEQIEGRVWQFTNQPETAQGEIFLNISGRVFNDEAESGLLGMAFHPDFPATPYVYLSYTRRGAPLISIISRFTSADGGNTLDPASEQILLTLDQPSKAHQGGHLAFGSDGYLYIGFGDGGHVDFLDPFAPDDPLGHGQNTQTLFSALLRIDVNKATSEPYSIPTDNPFITGGGRPEIYAYGFRNPWRWSFDRATGELWLGDVGESRWEEVNQVQAGGNYGWSIKEGTACFPPEVQSCSDSALIDPYLQYSHADGCSITGGFVYRGAAIPELQGQYVFGDFCSGQIWRLNHDAQGQPKKQTLLSSGLGISSFAEDQTGELYVLDWFDGSIYKISPSQATGGDNNFPQLLSQTGCVDPDNPQQSAQGLIPYSVNTPFWSDHAAKARWLALPEGETITIDAQNNWQFPLGTVLAKNFELNNELIETRLLVRHTDGDWAGYSYAWREDKSDADYVAGGKTQQIDNQEWIYPSSEQCLRCHTQIANSTLGLTTAQLNRDHFYSETNITANQLVTFNRIGLFRFPILEQPEQHPSQADPFDPSQPLAQRARAYLDSNCAQCHQPGGPTRSAMDLRLTTTLAASNTCEQRPQLGALGIEDAYLIAPSAPERSILLNRMARRDLHGMPPLGSNQIDANGVALLEKWISSLTSCL